MKGNHPKFKKGPINDDQFVEFKFDDFDDLKPQNQGQKLIRSMSVGSTSSSKSKNRESS